MTKHVSPAQETASFRAEILSGLAKPQKTISSKWLYDDVGSHLFEAITALDAYYPTRTELRILEENAAAYARLPGAKGAMVELGSGSSRKTHTLLHAFQDLTAYLPVDISTGHLKEAAERIRRAFPSLAVIPVAADFTQPLGKLPLLPELPVLVFFPGSTIGNFETEDAINLLAQIRSAMPGAHLIIGADRPKDETVLMNAYDDPAGVTAAFNLNLLQRLNRELTANFNLAQFKHRTDWNKTKSRIELHLVSLTAQTVSVAGQTFNFLEGETIHTENSHKYSEQAFEEIAGKAGWRVLKVDHDPDHLFSLYTLA